MDEFRIDGRLLSTQEVADFLGVPRETLLAWRRRGRGPKAIRLGRHLKWPPDELDHFLREQQRQQESV
jgi:excisionase family DNA binding protein